MLTTQSTSIRRAASQRACPDEAVAEIFDGINQPDMELAVFFASPDYDSAALATALNHRFHGIPTLGCTTAGEIGPLGYTQGGISAFSLSSRDFKVVSGVIENLSTLAPDAGKDCSQRLLARLAALGVAPNRSNTFGFLLVDGLSVREEILVSSIHKPLGEIALFGGSAADGLRFNKTLVWHNGQFLENAAVFSLICTELPFEVFRTQHFALTDQRFVVTDANPLTRIVHELNGAPAAEEYARMVGVPLEALSPAVFSANPLVMRVAGEPFVRAIAGVSDGNGLRLFCAIEKGCVLSLADGQDPIGGLARTLDGLHSRLGDLSLLIGCDCILRGLEFEAKELQSRVGDLLNRNSAVGFSTYGEQFNAVHVNQTLTGVGIGRSRG